MSITRPEARRRIARQALKMRSRNHRTIDARYRAQAQPRTANGQRFSSRKSPLDSARKSR